MDQSNFLPPVGTQVVTQVDIKNSAGETIFVSGAVGIIVQLPVDLHHAYRVRFPDGAEAPLKRAEFSIRSHHQQPATTGDSLAGVNLHDYVIYRCVTGSRAYGLDVDNSDTDRRGIYLPPT